MLGVITAGVVACGTAPRPGALAPGEPSFAVGQPWLDTDGAPIEAHGGGILAMDGTYYWYGENHALGAGNRTGISVYSSRDLHVCKNEGVALPRDSMPALFRDRGVVERPKVL